MVRNEENMNESRTRSLFNIIIAFLYDLYGRYHAYNANYYCHHNGAIHALQRNHGNNNLYVAKAIVPMPRNIMHLTLCVAILY